MCRTFKSFIPRLVGQPVVGKRSHNPLRRVRFSRPTSKWYNLCMGYTKEKQAEYGAAHYQANKEKYEASRLNSKERRHEVVRKLKDKPCMDCGGEFHSAVMHFHHRPGVEKVGSIGWLLRRRGMPAILAEIAKCDLLCANCHTMRHVNEGTIGVLNSPD